MDRREEILEDLQRLTFQTLCDAQDETRRHHTGNRSLTREDLDRAAHLAWRRTIGVLADAVLARAEAKGYTPTDRGWLPPADPGNAPTLASPVRSPRPR